MYGLLHFSLPVQDYALAVFALWAIQTIPNRYPNKGYTAVLWYPRINTSDLDSEFFIEEGYGSACLVH